MPRALHDGPHLQVYSILPAMHDDSRLSPGLNFLSHNWQ